MCEMKYSYLLVKNTSVIYLVFIKNVKVMRACDIYQF